MSTAVKLEFLGTGTSQGVPVIGCTCSVCASSDAKDKRLRSSVLVTWNELSLLVDTGPDLRQQLLRSGHDRIDAVLYTHEHADHIMGLDDIRAINFINDRNMPLYTSERVERAIRSVFHYAFAEQKYPGVPLVHFERISSGPFEVQGHTIIPIHAMHASMPVTGFRFGDLTYLTDVKIIPEAELEKVIGSKVVVVNALRIAPHHSHLNLEEALELAAAVGADRTYFTHISHLLGTHAEVAAMLPTGVELAYDGLIIAL